jgi:hypothetical protein
MLNNSLSFNYISTSLVQSLNAIKLAAQQLDGSGIIVA